MLLAGLAYCAALQQSDLWEKEAHYAALQQSDLWEKEGQVVK